MTALELVVVGAGVVAIALVNWWFFLAGSAQEGSHEHRHH